MLMASPSYNWYEVIQKEYQLQQGDFLDNFPIPSYSSPIEEATIDTKRDEKTPVSIYNVIVMTQSCDIAKIRDKNLYEKFVILCPRFDYKDSFDKSNWKPLCQGRVMNAHLLNHCEIDAYQFDYQVVSLDQIFSVPYVYVRKFADKKDRIRLLPPYREHLAQAFAKQFMRIGLPNDLPREYPLE
jgi:hypothetical protein